ncbi:MAG TPA: response regulator transcription factor, partial [Paracoccaceae bacterium]|nr:response regulator transcription factor [Paracoccaceae bacterium]
MRILIADDHDLLRDTLVVFLQGQPGLEPVAVRDLPEALAAMATGEGFDLVLLDYGMPGMNGLDGLRAALAAPGGARIALMSGTASREIAEEALAMGAAGFLPKTLAAKTLANAVR